ncbi:MAG: hypothetical protein ACHQAY_28070 [Hyphomicrobiales bacterium]
MHLPIFVAVDTNDQVIALISAGVDADPIQAALAAGRAVATDEALALRCAEAG